MKLAVISFGLLMKAVAVPKCHALRRTDRGLLVPLVLLSVATVVAAVSILVSRRICCLSSVWHSLLEWD